MTLVAVSRKEISMLLGDRDITQLIHDAVLQNAIEGNIGPVTYDLRTQAFHRDNESMRAVTLNPGDSVFVSSVENICLPEDIAARILIKNSRLRQGLSLDAPLYFPGHKTKLFFRVTNISADSLSLDTSKALAQIAFEQVLNVERPYEGTFSDEFSFKGLAGYTDIYKAEIAKIDQKKDELKSMEHRLYANTMALMAIFAAIFTLVNVNASVLSGSMDAVVTANLMVLGGFTFLAGVICLLMGPEKSRIKSGVVLVTGLAFIAASICLC